MLGTSGSACARARLVTASARSVPPLMCSTTGGSEQNAMGVCPATVEPIAGPPPLNGTWTRSRPNERRNCSPTKCGGVPVPGEAKLNLEGLDFDERDQLADRGNRQGRMDREHDLRGNGQCYRIEIPEWIVRDGRVHDRVDDKVRRYDEHGMPIWGCLRTLSHADAATGAANVLDIELLAKALRELFRGDARDNVIRATWRKRNNDADGPGRIRLRGGE